MYGNIISTLDGLNKIKRRLGSKFLERKSAIDMIILSIVSKKHSILIGGPGLAKTSILKDLVGRVKGFKLFDFQMSPSTKIEELMSGSNSGNAGAKETGIDNCDIALIDEFFKGPHSTLNSLLSIMNERIAYGPAGPKKIPLLCLFATSNERPDKSTGSGLLPLYDRFLFRMEILPVKDAVNFQKMLELKDYEEGERNKEGEDGKFDAPDGMSLGKLGLEELIASAKSVAIDGEVFKALYRIREDLKAKQVIVSDRRWRETVAVLKAAALLSGRNTAIKEDIAALEPSLWTYYSDIRAVKNVLRRELQLNIS